MSKTEKELLEATKAVKELICKMKDLDRPDTNDVFVSEVKHLDSIIQGDGTNDFKITEIDKQIDFIKKEYG